MKKTIKEAMKRISFLEQQIASILSDEHKNNYVEYSSEDDKEITDYDFHAVTKELDDIHNEVLLIRKAINKANQEVLVGIDNLTISDALVRVAQLNKSASRLEMLGSHKQKSRESTYTDTVEYLERLYDVKEAQKMHLECIESIHELQTAIDKANILTEIEY